MVRVLWRTTSDPSPFRDFAYGTCVAEVWRRYLNILVQVLYVVGGDESAGLGSQRYRVELRNTYDGYLFKTWVDEKAHPMAFLTACTLLKDHLYVVGATDSFWSVLKFDRELNLLKRVDFEKPRFAPFAVAPMEDLVAVCGTEVVSPPDKTALTVITLSRDLELVGKYSSNPMGKGAGAYAAAYNPHTKELAVGGFDKINGKASWRVEILDKSLVKVREIRVPLKGTVRGLAVGADGSLYAVGWSGVARIGRRGEASTSQAARGGAIAASPTAAPPLRRNVLVVSRDTLYVLSEDLAVVDSAKIFEAPAEALVEVQGAPSYNSKGVYVAATLMRSDTDWGMLILSVDPTPARR